MRLHAPAAERNADVIVETLRDFLPEAGLVVEVASGTGQHVAKLGAAFPGLRFVPTELDADKHPSIAAWTEGLPNVEPPQTLDAEAPTWPVEWAEVVFCANMIHIAPFAACEGLLRGAARVLRPRGLLVLYGPFQVGGEHTAPSNAAFDASLRARNEAWGVRDLRRVGEVASRWGLGCERVVEMPAHNKIVVFARSSPTREPETLTEP